MDSETNWEENYEEYLRLLQDGQYYEVVYDEESGGVSAIHQEHRFDKQPGPFGVRRGVYELMAIDALRKKGHVVVLESERAPNGVKTPDGKFDGRVMDIKAVENTGQWAIKDKLHIATKQGVEVLILYYHIKDLFSMDRIEDGWSKYLRDKCAKQYPQSVKRILCVVEDEVIEYKLPSI